MLKTKLIKLHTWWSVQMNEYRIKRKLSVMSILTLFITNT